MHKMTIGLTATFLALLASSTAFAEGVQMQKPVPYAADNDISDSIKTECKLGDEIADSIKEHSTVPISFGDAAGSGRVLQLEIIDAVSMGNAWLGHQKFAKVRGTLLDDGVKVASFKARRNSMGGAFGGFKGSCSVLGRTAVVLGEDIAMWLAAPKDGATLGD